MKKQFFILVFIISFACGCASASTQVKTIDVADKNHSKLMKLALGMSKQEVLAVMGTDQASAKCWFVDIKIDNPYKNEILQGYIKKFEILYYYTNSHDTDCNIDESDLTPMVFENGKLLGWGQNFFKSIKMKYSIYP